MNFGGFLALLISLALWGFIIFAVVLAVKTDIDEDRKHEIKAKKTNRKKNTGRK